jgi:hypothetical protein
VLPSTWIGERVIALLELNRVVLGMCHWKSLSLNRLRLSFGAIKQSIGLHCTWLTFVLARALGLASKLDSDWQKADCEAYAYSQRETMFSAISRAD